MRTTNQTVEKRDWTGRKKEHQWGFMGNIYEGEKYIGDLMRCDFCGQ